MRTRLLALLLTLMTAVLIALGIPLAISRASAHQQGVIRDRVDDITRFVSDTQLTVVSDTVRAQDDSGLTPGPDPADLDMLSSELSRYEDVYGIRVGAFDRLGQPIAVSHIGFRVDPRSAAFTAALAGRRSDDPGQVWPWQRGRLVVAAPVIHRGDVVAVVVTDSPTGRMRSRVQQDWLILAAGEVVAVLAALLLANRLTGWVLRPVRVLDSVTHEIATGRLGARVAGAQGPPELRRLAGSFNEMADHVETVVEQQRAFAADASHQLRNPLSALLLRIEELGLSLPPGHGDTLDGVRDEGRRLTHVLDELLELALAENARPSARAVDVAALVHERIDAWQALARSRDQCFEQEGPSALTGNVDPVTLGSALDAILDNALKFAPLGSTVTVGCSALGDRIEIRVSDRGPGLTFEEMRRVGDRFWRSPRHQNVDGSGLGLSIARTLLEAGDGAVDFTAREGGGLTVVLTVPRAD
ncbi:HAMP domain-containing sensor histidine kinase [Streptomyces sp. SID3343]|uniref:ATP-binding protein n=1 Tax=Streptomyces sp. SID3343 TaxID=2690260 RepID=UPI00136F87DD|nr:HAMP domain-containing protein [Streptomyces sp. SID3343]